MKKLLAVLVGLLLSFGAMAQHNFQGIIIDTGTDILGRTMAKVRKTDGNVVVVHHAQLYDSATWTNYAIQHSADVLNRLISSSDMSDYIVNFACSYYGDDKTWNDAPGVYTMYDDCIFDY